jgi:adenylate kinase
MNVRVLYFLIFFSNVANAFIQRSAVASLKAFVGSISKSKNGEIERKEITSESSSANLFKLSLLPNRKHLTISFSIPTDHKDDNPRPLSIIIAGAPASGKGTQCEAIKELYDVVHLSTGDILRAAVAARTPVGIVAKGYMDAGKLVPDEVIINIVKDRLQEEDCQTRGWLLDGFPRTKAQAEALKEAGVCADCFIFLNVPDEILVERVVGRRTDPVTGKIYHVKYFPPPEGNPEILSRLVQRSDDTEEKVVVRLRQFHDNVAAVKGYYTDISVEIDGTSKPSEVSDAIVRAIEIKCGRRSVARV